MKRFIITVIATFFTLCPIVAQKQITLSGVVKNNDEPVIGAGVTAVEAGVSTLTDQDGKFLLRCTIGVGGTSLRVSYIGLQTVVTRKYTETTTNIVINMEEDAKKSPISKKTSKKLIKRNM